MIEVYHNPRCGKSREAIKYLEEKGAEFEIVEYMKTPLTPMALEEILEKLDMNAVELIRTNEAIWKEEFKGKELDDDELILAMIEHPKLMQRPIVVNEGKAVVARPVELIENVL